MTMERLNAFTQVKEVFFRQTRNISKSITPILALKVFIFNIDVDIQISDDGAHLQVAGSVTST